MSKKSSTTGAAALNETYLRGASASQLLGRLLDVFSALEIAAAQESQPATNGAKGPEFSIVKSHKGIATELAKREYLTTPSPDAQVAVACCLSCIIGGGALAGRGAPNPIPKDLYTDAQCLDILKLMVTTIEYLQTATGKQSYHSYIRQLLEKLSARHGLQSLLARLAPSGKAGEADECSEALFKVFLSLSADDDTMIAQMGSIICDAIETHQSLTETQLQAILAALTSAAGGASTNTTPRRLALAVLRRKEEVVASAVGSYIVHEIEAAVEEMVAAEVAAIDDSSEETSTNRKAAVKRVGAILETTIAVCKVGVGLSSGIIPRLQLYLTNDNNDIRLIFTRTFARVFLALPALAQSFTPAYHSFLGRFTDTRVPIRIEMLKFAKDALLASPLSDSLWAILSPTLVNKLIDSDESVRRAAVGVVVDIALTVPRRVPNRLYEHLASRCKDKTIKVRTLAIERLSELYLKTRLQWIPNAIFGSVMYGADASVVEFALGDMLPKPVDSGSSAGVAANRKKQSTLAAAGKQKTAYKFDFEKEGHDGEDRKDSIIDPTFLGTFSQLCGSFDDANWGLMLTLMGKKAQLRLTCLRLVQFRQALKASKSGGNLEDNRDATIRLINFLTVKTNGDWGTLFKEKDETATQWLLQLCDTSCTDYFKQGEVLLDTKVKGRANVEIYKFLSSNILKRLCLPFSTKDVEELVATIEAGRKRKDEPKDRLGSVRALEAITRMAPHLALATATPQLTKWITEDTDLIRRGQNPELSKVIGTSLNILSDIAAQGSANEELPKEVLDRKKEIITTLGKLCVSSEDGSIAKRAAKCLTSLFQGQTNAFHQLMANVQEKLAVIAKQGESAITPTTISMIRSFGAFAATCPDAIVISSDGIAESITTIMLTAVRAHRDEDDVDAAAITRKHASLLTYPCLFAEVVDACAKSLSRHVLSLPGHRAVSAVPQLFDTFLKAFKETQFLPTGSAGACRRRLALHKQLLRLLIKGEAIFSSASAAPTVAPPTTRKGKNGAAVTSTVTSQAVAGNLELMRKELSVVSMISSEDNDEIRHAVQAKLKDHILKAIPAGLSDTRKVAMLCMTAIAEDGKAGYHSLKATLADIAERLNLFKVQQKVTLADGSKAWRYFLEYAVPPLVTYMAHHTTYQIEKDDEEAPFKHFQKPWQLLLDELLKDSTESASALQEMFRKLRVLDDAIPSPPEDVATRVICDLGCKVLLTILGEKSVASGAAYPGSLLIPWYFIKPLDANRYASEQVFLPSTVQVTARPLFGVPVSMLAGGGGGAKPSQSAARGVSRSVAYDSRGGVNGYDNDNANTLDEPTTTITPSMTPAKLNGKRGRDDAEEASPQPKATATAKGAAADGSKKLTRTEEKESPKKAPAKAKVEEHMPNVPEELQPLTKNDAKVIFKAVYHTISKVAPEEAENIKFVDIRVAVQNAFDGRKWQANEKEYAKLCAGAVQEMLHV